MEALLQRIVESLVDNPQNIKIQTITGQSTDVLELKVDKTDIGKVIGKKGRTANSLRTILAAASAKADKRVILEILD